MEEAVGAIPTSCLLLIRVFRLTIEVPRNQKVSHRLGKHANRLASSEDAVWRDERQMQV